MIPFNSLSSTLQLPPEIAPISIAEARRRNQAIDSLLFNAIRSNNSDAVNAVVRSTRTALTAWAYLASRAEPAPFSAGLGASAFALGFDSLFRGGLGQTKILISRNDLKEHPKEVLHTVIEKFNKKELVDTLCISFIGEAGIDAGGLSRQFICDLFLGVAKALSCKQYPNGLFRPELAPGQSLDAADELTYRSLGRLMMFCLNAAKSYPIGMVFEEGVYGGIQAFPDELLDQRFTELVNNEDNFNALLNVYEKINAYDESSKKSVDLMKQYLEPWDESTRAPLIETAYELVEGDLLEGNLLPELQGVSDVPTLIKNADVIQKALRKYYMSHCFSVVLAPIHAIASGMRTAEFQDVLSWPEIKEMGTEAFSEALQGKVDAVMIIERLRFQDVPSEKEAWMKNWIKSSDENTLRQFLHAVTGSNALGTMNITIGNTRGREVQFHTCSNILDVPFSVIQSEQDFKSIIEAAITGEHRFETG